MVCKMPVWEGAPWEAGSSPQRLRESSEISCNGALGSAAAPERVQRGRLYPKQGIRRLQSMGASSGLCDHVQGTPRGNFPPPPRPVCCRHLPSARARMAVSCVPPQQPGLGQPCFPPRSVPSHPIPAPQRKSLARVHCCGICCTARGASTPNPPLTRQCPQQDGVGPTARNPPRCRGCMGLGETRAGRTGRG